MTVDVTRPEGLEIFKDLISKSDVFIENNMPDTMKKLGLVYSELKKHNPGLIMVRDARLWAGGQIPQVPVLGTARRRGCRS